MRHGTRNDSAEWAAISIATWVVHQTCNLQAPRHDPPAIKPRGLKAARQLARTSSATQANTRRSRPGKQPRPGVRARWSTRHADMWRLWHSPRLDKPRNTPRAGVIPLVVSPCGTHHHSLIYGTSSHRRQHKELHYLLCTVYLVSLKYLSRGSCLFRDVPTLLCRSGFTECAMVSHNSIQTAFTDCRFGTACSHLLTIHARIQCIFCYRLVAIMSTCYQLVAVESAYCMGQTDAPGGSAHALSLARDSRRTLVHERRTCLRTPGHLAPDTVAQRLHDADTRVDAESLELHPVDPNADCDGCRTCIVDVLALDASAVDRATFDRAALLLGRLKRRPARRRRLATRGRAQTAVMFLSRPTTSRTGRCASRRLS